MRAAPRSWWQATAWSSSVANRDVERLGPFLDQPKPEVDVAEQPPLLGGPERRRPTELAGSADVVEQGGREEQICAQAGMELRGLPGKRRDADRVLEQPARVGVVRLGGRERAERGSKLRVVREAAHDRHQPRMRDLRREELEKAVELVRVAAQPGRQLAGIRIGRLDRTDVQLEPFPELRDAAEHAHRIAFGEATVEKLDVVPDPGLDPARRVDELEREVRRALLRPQPLLARDGVDAFDDAILCELVDGAHELSLGGR